MAKSPPETEWERQARIALKEGDAFTALRILEVASLHAKLQPEFPYLYAQALAQTGQSRKARVVLMDLLNRGNVTCDILSLVGRTFKETWLRTGSTEALSAAIAAYRKAVELAPADAFPTINAASLSLLAGNVASARELAKHALQLCQKPQKPKDDDRWRDATLGEAYLCLGDFDKAQEHYGKVIADGMDVRERCSARRHARILLEYLGKDVHALDDCFGAPTVIVFSGHMLDSPRCPPRERRFPAALEPAVASEIRQRVLAVSLPAIGFSSAAAGSDILFLEQMRSFEQTYHILLSGPQNEFVERSVSYAEADWGERFQKIVTSAKSVEEANSHHPADNSPAYWFATRLLSGRALMQAKQLNLDLIALAVWNGKPGVGMGGTASFIDYWSLDFPLALGQTKPNLKIIPLDSLIRERVEIRGAVEEPTTPSHAKTDKRSACQIQQDIKAILFANVVGFNALAEEQLPLFNEHFLGAASQLLSASSDKPSSVNAWGNGFYMVFDEEDQAGRFALQLRRILEPPPGGEADWSRHSLPADLGIRIALHAGPVFSMFNPLVRHIAFTGRHMNLAAALETTTKKGEIFTTEHFAVLASTSAHPSFFCEYIGQRTLPADAGAVRVYRLIQAE
jgi:class 3 adenylate cyclase/tetratricopeptide (TPR) repeat protein